MKTDIETQNEIHIAKRITCESEGGSEARFLRYLHKQGYSGEVGGSVEHDSITVQSMRKTWNAALAATATESAPAQADAHGYLLIDSRGHEVYFKGARQHALDPDLIRAGLSYVDVYTHPAPSQNADQVRDAYERAAEACETLVEGIGDFAVYDQRDLYDTEVERMNTAMECAKTIRALATSSAAKGAT